MAFTAAQKGHPLSLSTLGHGNKFSDQGPRGNSEQGPRGNSEH